MELSVREAATLMGRSPRTVRAQVARGELPGIKKNGQWRIRRRHLPLTEAQHLALQEKAQNVRDAVESVLPSRIARHSSDRTKSIIDLEAFRSGASVLRSLRSFDGEAPLNVSCVARSARSKRRCWRFRKRSSNSIGRSSSRPCTAAAPG
jgi:excisionase family DNA binding protein